MKLKIFSDRQCLLKEIDHEAILLPFWGNNIQGNNSELELFNDYLEAADSVFEMSSLTDADVAVLPTNWEPILRLRKDQMAIQFFEKVKQTNKLSISFFGGDCSHIQLPIASSLVFRNSLYRYRRDPNSFAIPAWSEDLIKKYCNDRLLIRNKQPQPSIGFCGFAAKKSFKSSIKIMLYQGGKQILKEKIGIPPYSIGHVLRSQLLSDLEKSQLVKTNFIQRDSSVFFDDSNSKLKQQLRMEFVRNTIESDYVFCCRGSGNYSFRFYEALCCGRIPVFIDTDCVLPYDFLIDWNQYCVWVKESEIPYIDEKILEFHERLSPRDFVDLQYECRRVWQEWISPKGFFTNLYRHLPLVSPSNPLKAYPSVQVGIG